jgi:hypothetical protein
VVPCLLTQPTLNDQLQAVDLPQCTIWALPAVVQRVISKTSAPASVRPAKAEDEETETPRFAPPSLPPIRAAPIRAPTALLRIPVKTTVDVDVELPPEMEVTKTAMAAWPNGMVLLREETGLLFMKMPDGSIFDHDGEMEWPDASPVMYLSGSEEKWPSGKPISVGNQVAMLMDGRLMLPDGGIACPVVGSLLQPGGFVKNMSTGRIHMPDGTPCPSDFKVPNVQLPVISKAQGDVIASWPNGMSLKQDMTLCLPDGSTRTFHRSTRTYGRVTLPDGRSASHKRPSLEPGAEFEVRLSDGALLTKEGILHGDGVHTPGGFLVAGSTVFEGSTMYQKGFDGMASKLPQWVLPGFLDKDNEPAVPRPLLVFKDEPLLVFKDGWMTYCTWRFKPRKFTIFLADGTERSAAVSPDAAIGTNGMEARWMFEATNEILKGHIRLNSCKHDDKEMTFAIDIKLDRGSLSSLPVIVGSQLSMTGDSPPKMTLQDVQIEPAVRCTLPNEVEIPPISVPMDYFLSENPDDPDGEMDIVFCFSVDFETATIGDPTVDLTGERARLGLFLNENMVPCGDGEGIESTDPKLCKEFPSLDLSRALQKRWIMGVELRCTRPPGKRHGATGKWNCTWKVLEQGDVPMGAGYGSKGGEPTDDEAMQQLNDRVRFCANNEDLKKLIDKAEKAELLALLAAIGVQPNAGGLKMLRKQLASSANLVLLWKQFRALAVKWPKRWPDRFTPQDPWVTSPTLLDVDRAHANCLDCGAKGQVGVGCEGFHVGELAHVRQPRFNYKRLDHPGHKVYLQLPRDERQENDAQRKNVAQLAGCVPHNVNGAVVAMFAADVPGFLGGAQKAGHHTIRHHQVVDKVQRLFTRLGFTSLKITTCWAESKSVQEMVGIVDHVLRAAPNMEYLVIILEYHGDKNGDPDGFPPGSDMLNNLLWVLASRSTFHGKVLWLHCPCNNMAVYMRLEDYYKRLKRGDAIRIQNPTGLDEAEIDIVETLNRLTFLSPGNDPTTGVCATYFNGCPYLNFILGYLQQFFCDDLPTGGLVYDGVTAVTQSLYLDVSHDTMWKFINTTEAIRQYSVRAFRDTLKQTPTAIGYGVPSEESEAELFKWGPFWIPTTEYFRRLDTVWNEYRKGK